MTGRERDGGGGDIVVPKTIFVTPLTQFNCFLLSVDHCWQSGGRVLARAGCILCSLDRLSCRIPCTECTDRFVFCVYSSCTHISAAAAPPTRIAARGAAWPRCLGQITSTIDYFLVGGGGVSRRNFVVWSVSVHLVSSRPMHLR